MDGQRRIARPMKRNRRETELNHWTSFGNRRGVRIAARSGAVLFLLSSIGFGLLSGGHLDYPGSPYMQIPGKLAGLVGFAAVDVNIVGLSHHEAEQLLSVIGVKAGGSLINFDAADAKSKLEKLDWVAEASVQRIYPNQLELVVEERAPFAIWQTGGHHFVIDRRGVAMSGLDATTLKTLPKVTGDGANLFAEELVNQLEANPALLMKVAAAARVGKRRWTLYLDNGVKIALPENDVPAALAKVVELDTSTGLLAKGISEVDLRVAGKVRIAIAEVAGDPVTTSSPAKKANQN